MSKLDYIKQKVKEILGECNGYIITNKKMFENDLPDAVCIVQDCNMGGSYFRNFYISNGRLLWFMSDTSYYDNNEDYSKYEHISEFVSKRTKKSPI